MTNEDYQATGIEDFDKLADLLETRRNMIQTLVNIIDGSQHKVTAYSALKAVRVHFDKAVFDELQKILESHKAVKLLEKSTTKPAKPKMTDEQKRFVTVFKNSLAMLQNEFMPYMARHFGAPERYTDILNDVQVYGKKLLAHYKNQFEE